MSLAILTSHPIQYQVPLWRRLNEAGIPSKVWFLSRHGTTPKLDREFGSVFAWDIDLLGGYDHEFLRVKEPPDITRFHGVRLAERLGDRMRHEQVTHLWVEGWRFKVFCDAVNTAGENQVTVLMRGESNDLRGDGPVKRLIKKIILGRHLSKVDHFLCIGSANRRFYRRYGIPESKLTDAPYCVDNDRFEATSDQLRPRRSEIRKRWGIADDAKVVLFCGKLINKKRPEHLFAAVNKLFERGGLFCDLHVLVVGSGELKASLFRSVNVVFDESAVQLESTRNGPPVSFVGFLNQSEMPEAYVAADLLVLPSDTGETWGLVVNEAMACGLPVVSSDLVGCAEDLPARLDGNLVYRFGDIDDLARAIQYALEKAIPIEKVKKVAEQFHFDHTVNTLKHLLQPAAKAVSCG